MDWRSRSATRRAFLAGLAATAGIGACSRAPAASPGDGSTDAGPSRSSAAPSRTPDAPQRTRPASARSDLLHGPRHRPAVALTFHGAGDPVLATRVLAEANAVRAGLTIMAVGSWLQQNAALGTAILDAGHDLGNHTWSHQPMRRLSAGQARREVARGADVLRRLTGTPGRWFRPSGTPRSTATIRAAALASGYDRCLAYDVDSLDYTDPGADAVTRRVLDEVRPGSIVSLHLGHQGTVVALPQIFAGLSDKALQPVTVTQLVAGTG